MGNLSRGLTLVALVVVSMTACTNAATATFNGFVIRNANGTGAVPTFTATSNSITATIDQGGQKVGFGTDFFDGSSVASIQNVNYDRNDGGTGEIYSNLWVTNTTGKYALLTPRFVNGAAYTSSTVNGVDLQTLGFGLYGTNRSDTDWIFAGSKMAGDNLVKADGSTLTLADIGGLTIGSPSTFGTGPGEYSAAGGGDPKAGYGFQLIFGDSGTNHTNAVPYAISNVAVNVEAPVVPAPAAIFGGTALFGMLGFRRKRA